MDTEAVAAAVVAPSAVATTRALPNSGATAAAAIAAAREGPPMARAVPAVADIEDAVDVCGFYEGLTASATDAVLPPGVYTLQVRARPLIAFTTSAGSLTLCSQSSMMGPTPIEGPDSHGHGDRDRGR